MPDITRKTPIRNMDAGGPPRRSMEGIARPSSIRPTIKPLLPEPLAPKQNFRRAPNFQQPKQRPVIKTASAVNKPLSPSRPVTVRKSPRRGFILPTILTTIVILGFLGWLFWRQKQNPKINQSALDAQSTSTQQAILNQPSASSTITVSPDNIGKNPDELFGQPAKMLTIKSTPLGYANARELPESNSKILAKLPVGQSFVYTDTKNGWYKVLFNDGSTAWVIGTYVTLK